MDNLEALTREAFERMVELEMPAINELLDNYAPDGVEVGLYEFVKPMVGAMDRNGLSDMQIVQAIHFFLCGWCAARRYSK